MIFAIILLFIASLFGSGILFKHQRILTFLATAGVIWDALWLLLTLLDRILPVSTNNLFFIGSVFFLLLFISFYRSWTFPPLNTNSLRRDAFILIPLLLALGSAWLISSRNGYTSTGDWISHGFFNGDTMTLASLTNRARLTGSFTQTNPFNGGGALEYPTLSHAGLATLLLALDIGLDWLRFLPLMTYLQIIVTVPMFFLLWDVIFPFSDSPATTWLGTPAKKTILAAQSIIVLFVMTISWDSFVYPQTHFFLMPILLLLTSLSARSSSLIGWPYFLPTVLALCITILLLLSNAVLGSVAIVLTLTNLLLQIKSASSKLSRLLLVTCALGLLAAFFLFSPGHAAFGWPSFSYTAAESLMRLSPIMIILAVVLILNPASQPLLSLSGVALSAMTFFTFFFSQREIIVANAERFIYHALLISFPLLLIPGISLFYWLRRHLLYQSHNYLQHLINYSALMIFITFLLFPPLISLSRTHDHLLFQDEITIPSSTIDALSWLANNTSPSSVILASPDYPFIVPMFTGRTQLRADYWLGLDDKLLTTVKQAFQGDAAAQTTALRSVNYVLLTDQDINWQLDQYDRVFQNPTISIFKI